MTARGRATDVLRGAFGRFPPAHRLAILHRLGRFAPWEAQFDFTPPALGPGEEAGPPDFGGIGVQKAGTTWWFDLLLAHPGVSTRSDLHKERHFFDRFGIESFGDADIEGYHGWFPRRDGRMVGEWTPDYFTLPWVAPLLKQAAPAARLLVLLRDPVERYRSGIAHQRQAGVPSDGATQADALYRGFYDRALSHWVEHFDRTQILVLQYERCTNDLDGQLAATFAFLGLAEHHVSDIEQPPRSRPSTKRPELSDDARRRLVELYAPDVEALAARLPEIDLRLWPNFAYLAGEVAPSPPPAGGAARSPTTRR
jgi:Sulfotransferase family